MRCCQPSTLHRQRMRLRIGVGQLRSQIRREYDGAFHDARLGDTQNNSTQTTQGYLPRITINGAQKTEWFNPTDPEPTEFEASLWLFNARKAIPYAKLAYHPVPKRR